MRTIAAPAIASILLLLSLFAFTQRPSIKYQHILDLPVASNGALVSFRFSGLAHLTILRDGTLIYKGSEISRELLREELSEWCSTRADDYPSLRISLHPDTPMHHLRLTYESIDDIGLASLYFTVYIVSRGA